MGRYDIRRAIEQLDPERDNQRRAHSHYRIANDDFLYVLSTFIYEPVRWIGAVGWRPTCPNEKLGYYAMIDDPMIRSFGFPRPLRGTRSMLRGGLKMRGVFVSWLPPRQAPRFFTDGRNRTHPSGYQIGALGPPRLVAAAERRQRADA